MKYLVLITISLLAFISCEKEISIDQKEFAPKIVLNSIINSENDTIIVELSESRDMLYDKFIFPPITNATIKLFDNDVYVDTLTEVLSGIYSISHTVLAGHTYRVEVSNTKFDNVKASTTVPTPAIITDFTANKDQNQKADINISFTDFGGEDNFYGIEVIRLDTLNDTTYNNYGDYYPSTYSCSNSAAIEYPLEDGLSDERCASIYLMSDKLFNGANFTFNCNNQSSFWGGNNENTDLVTTIWVNLKTMNEDYYQYLLSTNIAWENNGNPFSEPVRIYSNVEGGFGIFGSYSVYKDSISF